MTPRWARVSGNEAHGLRRGAWYPVVGDTSSILVVLDVNRDNRPVNRTSLEFSDDRPNTWSVVRRSPEESAAQRASQARLGPVYGVCPECRARATLQPDAVRLACPECGSDSAIDWRNPC